MGALRWDIFGRVVDNYGDVGLCWRLAAQLAARGDAVRLVLDDHAALAWMAPGGAAGVELLHWPGPALPGDVVIEAFGCDPPGAFVAAMRAAARPPVWINLEYLSAQDYVERSHGLPSPQRDGQTKWFFYPGFTPRTGGLLREDGLAAERAAFERTPWLAALDAAPRPGERVVSLFCYANAALPPLLRDLAAAPTLLLLTPGPAQAQVDDAALSGALRTRRLPWLDQRGYDRLLWSCDLNFVRGEDSLVRAVWAGAPFVWQAYPQHDGAHHAKLDALLARLSPPAEAAALMRAWNGLAPWPGLPPAGLWPHWRAALERWRGALLAQQDLATQLRRFVLGKRLNT
ncbi:MAG: elongation factor P maturation arginine rhamnosyltransferase EarP [Rubrivivax sp.]